jgi:hypothetical protein
MCVQSQYSKIDELVKLVHPQDGHRKVFAMIQAYLDESGIHDGAKICVIAGYFGGPAQLKRLERAWKQTMREFSFEMKDFHAKDLIKNADYWPMLFALADTVGMQRKVYPLSEAVVVDDFLAFSLEERRFLTGAVLLPGSGKLATSGCPSKAYFVPFLNVVKTVTDAAPRGGKAHFAFGIDKQFSEYAVAVFKELAKHASVNRLEQARDWKTSDRLGDPIFPKAAETPQLQAADLLVHVRYLQLTSPDRANPPAQVGRILRGCLANSRATSDHVFQDRECLKAVLSNARQLFPRWRAKTTTDN